jgi:O-antigen ligase
MANAFTGNQDLRISRTARRRSVAPAMVWLFAITVLATIFQIYTVSIANTYPPLSMVMCNILLASLFFTKDYKLSNALLFCGSLVLYQMISLCWAPDPMQGGRRVIYDELPFFAVFLATEAIVRHNPRTMVRIFKLYASVSLVQSIFAVTFRAFPGIEALFFHSSLGSSVINPNGLREALQSTVAVPVFSFDKAGGLLLYPNGAGLWGFANACIALCAAQHGRKPVWYGIAIVHLASTIACGSKASIVLLLATPVFTMMLFVGGLSRRTKPATLIAALVAAIGATLLFSVLMLSDEPGAMVSDMSTTLDSREVMWTFAREKFAESPFVGLGFGGWSDQYRHWAAAQGYRGMEADLPPHNGFIYIWSESGLVAVLLAVVASASLLWMTYRARMAPGARMISACAFASYFWLLAQSMGENWNIFGESHTQAAVALMLGYASYYARNAPKKMMAVALPRGKMHVQ